MAETVIMPKLGFDMAEGTLVRWVKKAGEEVAKGDVLAEIETDKATVEVESPYAGVVARQLVEQGAVVPVGDPIAIVAAPGEKIEEIQTTGSTPAQPEQKPPELVEQAPGPEQQKKPEVAPPTPSDIEELKNPETAPATPPAPDTIPSADGGLAPASPLARKVARERGIDLAQVKGSGPGGRIVRKDLEKIQPEATGPAGQAAPTGEGVPAESKPNLQRPAVWLPPLRSEIPADKPIPLTRLRQAIGKRMTQSSQEIPIFYVTYDYDVEKLVALRKDINASLSEDEKISYNDFIVKAAALTLRQYPNMNASLSGSEVLHRGHINIGVAVSVEGGLLTVVSRDADQKPLRVISAELNGMITRVTSGKVRQEDIEGSTFSTSNLGMFGVEDFVAIINPPDVAILAIGTVRETPVVSNGEIKVGFRMKATISADHRVTDGAEAARFMESLGMYLENPVLLALASWHPFVRAIVGRVQP